LQTANPESVTRQTSQNLTPGAIGKKKDQRVIGAADQRGRGEGGGKAKAGGNDAKEELGRLGVATQEGTNLIRIRQKGKISGGLHRDFCQGENRLQKRYTGKKEKGQPKKRKGGKRSS